MWTKNLTLLALVVAVANGSSIRSTKTCKSFFDKENSDVCYENGYRDCCKNFDETCQICFDQNGKSMCTDNDYQHRRDHSTVCDQYPCEIDECCKNKIEVDNTCELYFSENGKSFCTDNGYKNRRDHSTVCDQYPCEIKECCKNQIPLVIEDVESDCKKASDCSLEIKGTGFAKDCTVALYDASWTPEEPLAILDADCSATIVEVDVPKKIAQNNDQVNLLVRNEFENIWTDPVLVTLD
eukprot:Awhi_evm1s4984